MIIDVEGNDSSHPVNRQNCKSTLEIQTVPTGILLPILLPKTMNHILEHSNVIIDFKLNRQNLWDFTLNDNLLNSYQNTDESKLICMIDFNNPNCIWWNNVFSLKDFYYDKSKNEGLILENIGITGTDNGVIEFQKDRISNEQFLDITFNSKLTIEKDDFRLHLQKINGNNNIFDYTCDIVNEENIDISRFNGGFYQGFWKTSDNQYQVLPDNIGKQTVFEFELKKSDLINTKYNLNDKHPENKGIFFYIGTRSENKWYRFYNDITNWQEDKCQNVIADDVINNKNEVYPLSYIQDITPQQIYDIELKKGGYIDEEYIKYDKECICDECQSCLNYFEDDYISDDIDIKESDIKTKTDKLMSDKFNEVQIHTDNKFLLFDRTKEGYTINNWDRENEQATIITTKKVDVGNYHLLFNRTKEGYNIHNIQELIDEKLKEYNVLSDLYKNALCFQIKEDGSIGYKYLVKDCETSNYKIENEWSKADNIKKDVWYKIKIVVTPYLKDYMKLKFYINDKLVLISKSLPLLNLHKLDEYDEKQEGVPFNISIGGGTQGLSDVVYFDYMNFYDKILPIEENFCGSFVGYMKSFKMWHLESLAVDKCK